MEITFLGMEMLIVSVGLVNGKFERRKNVDVKMEKMSENVCKMYIF